jgi:hypothetical protein
MPVMARTCDVSPVLRIRIRDPVRLTPGWVKKSRSRSGMNIPDHVSESLETFFDEDPESFWPGIRNGSIRIRGPG